MTPNGCPPSCHAWRICRKRCRFCGWVPRVRWPTLNRTLKPVRSYSDKRLSRMYNRDFTVDIYIRVLVTQRLKKFAMGCKQVEPMKKGRGVRGKALKREVFCPTSHFCQIIGSLRWRFLLEMLIRPQKVEKANIKLTRELQNNTFIIICNIPLTWSLIWITIFRL